MAEKKLKLSHTIIGSIIVAILYFIAGKLSLMVALTGTNATPIWPPSGLALTFVLLWGYRILPGVFLGSFLLNIGAIAALTPGYYFWVILASFLTGVGAAIQAGVGAWLIIHTTSSHFYFSDGGNTLKFLFFGGIVSSLINSNIGTLALISTGAIDWSLYPVVWLTWWIGDSVGVCIVAPLLIVWITCFKRPQSFWRTFEAFGVFLALLIVSLVYNLTMRAYLYIPIIIWATLRFRLLGATATNFVAVIAVSVMTLAGKGPFAELASFHVSLISLDFFILVITSSFLVLAAELEKRDKIIQDRWVASGKPMTTTMLVMIKRVRHWFK